MRNAQVLLAFVVLAGMLTFPLALHYTTAIAGPPNDGFIHLYEMYWFKRAIFDLHVWPLFNPETFYPFGYNLALSHITPSNTIPMLPIVHMAGPIAGFNTAVFLSFILSGFGAYLLVLRLTRNRWAGFLAGILYAFSAYRMHNLGAGWLPNLGTQWLPFALLYLDRLISRPLVQAAAAVPTVRTSLRNGMLAGFFFALVCLSSWYHVYIAGVAVLVFMLARGRPWRRWLFTRRVIAGGGAFCLVAVLMILPIALPLLQYGSAERSDIVWPLIEADDASASIDDLLLPSAYHPLWGDLALARRSTTFAIVAPGLVYLGLPALLLGLYALRRKAPEAGAFFLVGLVGAVLTLGLTLHINGERLYIPVPGALEEAFSRVMSTVAGKLALNPGSYWPFRAEGAIPIPMPGMAFSLFIPFGSTMRVFHRFGMASSLGFAIVAGLGVAAIASEFRTLREFGTLKQRLVAAGLTAIILLDIAAAPLPYGVSDARGSGVDLWLKEQAGDFSVIHLPLARGLNGPGLYRAAIHGKKISYGYGTFYPQAWRQAVGQLGSFPNPEAIALLKSWNVRYILLGQGTYEQGRIDVPGDSWEKVQERLKTTPGLRYVRTFDEVSPTTGDRLSPKLSVPWLVTPVVVDRTHVYEIIGD